MLVKACVNSGMCCIKAPCGFGEWNEDKTQCKHLEFDEKGMSRCGDYERISKDPSSVVSPAFGAGCCMSMFNERRDAIIEKHYDGRIPVFEADWD
ncbi:hypothetical protein [Vibrio owensii]|uniref:hypothetical protein n=1 Tax=Vibrio harveyi group TaxID=717610 RepID=UPI003CC517C3